MSKPAGGAWEFRVGYSSPCARPIVGRLGAPELDTRKRAAVRS